MVYKSLEGKEEIEKRVHALIEALPFTVESRYLESEKFGRTHCLLAGDESKPPLVLLHGASSNGLSWGGYMADWAGEYRLIVPDMPGQPGLSSDRRPPVAELLPWLDGVADGLGLESFYLCGMSLGGWLGLGYALEHQERVKALALIAPSGLTQPRISFFLRMLPLMFLGDRGAGKINRLIYGSVPMGREEEEFGLLVGRHFKPLTEPLAVYTDEQLAGLTLPVYYAGGEKDPMLDTLRSAERVPRTEGGVVVEILPDRAHVILDRAGAISRFFRGDARAAG